MGLTKSSTGSSLLASDFELLKTNSDYVVALSRKSKCRKINYF